MLGAGAPGQAAVGRGPPGLPAFVNAAPPAWAALTWLWRRLERREAAAAALGAVHRGGTVLLLGLPPAWRDLRPGAG